MNDLRQFLLIIFMMGMSACTSPEAAETPVSPTNENNPLADSEWTLASFGPTGEETPVLAGTAVTLSFDAAGQAGGSGGCNSYGADYQVQDDALIFGEIVSTLMACTDEGVTEQEQRYLEALRSAGEFEEANDQLTITYDAGQGALHFVAADTTAETPVASESESSLAGTQWQLESFGPAASEMSVIAGSTITLEFETAAQAGGTGGCNVYGGDYTVQGDAISFAQINSTLRACEPSINEQEQRYFEALQTAVSFTQTADQLTILYNDGKSVLNFTPDTSAGDDASSKHEVTYARKRSPHSI